MEVPTTEDSMEMASPYHGHADDFDIDIDLMEDNVSNMDSEMMGADDYLGTSHASLFTTEANGDADMADGPSEGSMVDADLVDQDPDVEIEFEDTTYEAEMLEDDQDEGNTIPIPSVQVEPHPEPVEQHHGPSETLTQAVEEPAHQPKDGVDTTGEESIPSGSVEAREDPQPQESNVALGEVSLEPINAATSAETFEGSEQYSKADSSAFEDHSQSHVSGTNEDSSAVIAPLDDTVPVNDAAAEKDDEEIPQQIEATEIPQQDHHADEAADVVEPEKKDEAAEGARIADEDGKNPSKDPATTSAPETDDQSSFDEEESLHPVKVYYQETEISLFPPLEGDSSETFFLHDEEIAYDHIGRLFKSLREVLLDNVAENEVLVIDIDSLGIQLTEDCSHLSTLTLHRILNVYLRLCQNEGNSEPEAFYLTLSSKPAVSSELAALEAAAGEGKGLSQIHPWSGYEDGDDIDDGEATQTMDRSLEESHELQTHQKSSSGTDNPEPRVSVHVEEVNVVEHVHQEAHPDETTTSPDHETTSITVGNEDTVSPPHNSSNAVEKLDDSREEQYDSEAPRTESTSTLVATSDRAGETESAGDISTASGQALLEQDGEQIGDGGEHADTSEESSGARTLEQELAPASQEQTQEDIPDEYHEEDDNTNEAEAEADVHVIDFAAADDRDVHVGESDPAPLEQEPGVDTVSHDADEQNEDQWESAVEAKSLEESTTLETAADPEDDLLEHTRDNLQDTAGDLEETFDHEDEDFQQEYGNEQLDFAADDAYGGDYDANHVEGGHDEEQQDILVFTEHTVGEQDSAPIESETHDKSSKRSRGDDDEWDLDETCSLEPKRRRPS
ncbi:hypothetical protein N7539_002892 [Penicillium diatomitis]|uniref:Uncharacterized protein n=1 Tax=Penicillium diatomitis TaxID=2819901 RepID=A0A9W9XFI3_9EURO|nr:uncharacterized protein N7539_002892 [Penicillium diatomitis]KAJ5491325.1 hypothetical protein N7539_002892 [Penicillium diatomitis]